MHTVAPELGKTKLAEGVGTSGFWVEKGARKHREKYVVFFSAVEVLAQVYKVQLKKTTYF